MDNNLNKKKLPIGIENFDKIRTEEFYYIDKTGLIKELLQNWGEVNLITRPRRFGKSLNMSMLRSFFEIGGKKELFEGLDISDEKELCENYRGQFPVISISLKGIYGKSYEIARDMAVRIVNEEARRHYYLFESDRLNEHDKEMFSQLLQDNMGEADFCCSLRRLSELLQKHYEKKVVMLVDEYDVPLAKAFDNGYYDQMIMLIRNLFEQALKTNDSLYFAVMTGCLRVSKESIFTGLNNPKILSITDVRFDEYFGFTDQEVRELLEYYNLSDVYGRMKEWYDGYHFGNVDVYCPWDVICYCDALRANPLAQPDEYWSNTSGNDVVRHFIERADSGTTRREIERLVAGEEIVKEVRQELTYRELYDSVDNIWSVLFMTGYLTQRGTSDGRELRLAIPNTEIRNIFMKQIAEWFQETARKDGTTLNKFCDSFQNGDAAGVETQLNTYLKKTISIRDTFVRKDKKENFYHGILLGLLGYKESWGVWSNKETGDGYSDILVEIDEEEIGVIIEVKYAEPDELESACEEALHQIERMRYEEELRDLGMTKIYKYGIACYKKRCKVMCR